MTSSRFPGDLLEVHEITKAFHNGATTLAIRDVSFSLAKSEFLSILGPSGCGKTTLLRIIAGLLPPSSGQVLLEGEEVCQPDGRAVLVFQEYSRSLLPWYSVLRNVQLGLVTKDKSKKEVESIARDFIALVGLLGFEAHYPWQLSGGMQQRVALARALACTPKLLLMDEPFGSLDARIREELEEELLHLWIRLKLSVIFVTHDIDEAIFLGQRILLLTERPARVRFLEEVPLAYPRDELVTRQSQPFLELRAKLHELLRTR